MKSKNNIVLNINKILYFLLFVLFINLFVLVNVVHSKMPCDKDTICTRAYKVYYDSKRNIFVIPEDKKRYSVNVVFTKQGKVIKFNDKNILYKNGRIAKIGNDYVTYLNGKLYTIGGKKVELGDFDNIYKIGDLTVHEYFIENAFSVDDVVKSADYGGMQYYLPADGKDFGAFFSDILIYFDGTEISDGSEQKQSKKYTGKDEIKYNCSYKGIPLYGKVKVVNIGENFRVRKVNNFGNIRVREVTFPEKCGQWKFVESLEDFKIKYVDSLEDFSVEFVNGLEGT